MGGLLFVDMSVYFILLIFIDANITGELILVSESATFIILQELGYTFQESLRIVGLVKSLVKCFEVRAEYIGAKKKKGIRGTIYKCAQEHKACYSLERSKSIYYDGSSNDLKIALLFRERGEADSFCVFLSHWYFNNPLTVQPGDVVVEDKTVMYVAESDLNKVLLSDYDPTDSESAIQTLEELACCGFILRIPCQCSEREFSSRTTPEYRTSRSFHSQSSY